MESSKRLLFAETYFRTWKYLSESSWRASRFLSKISLACLFSKLKSLNRYIVSSAAIHSIWLLNIWYKRFLELYWDHSRKGVWAIGEGLSHFLLGQLLPPISVGLLRSEFHWWPKWASGEKPVSRNRGFSTVGLPKLLSVFVSVSSRHRVLASLNKYSIVWVRVYICNNCCSFAVLHETRAYTFLKIEKEGM